MVLLIKLRTALKLVRNKVSETVTDNRENTEFTRLSVGAIGYTKQISQMHSLFTNLMGAG
jgi:hypothetical protein